MPKHTLCVLLLVAACGGDKIAIEDLPDSLADAQCAAQVRCGLQPDAATCAASNIIEGIEISTVEAAVEAGTIKYSESAAGDCINEISDEDCQFPGFHGDDSSPCNDLFQGAVAIGGACFVDLECEGTGLCRPTDLACDSDVACCPGTCVAGATEVPLDGDCSGANAFCEPNSYCSSGGVCSKLITEEGALCDAIDACGDKLFCNPEGAGTGRCLRPAASNEACDGSLLIACADLRDHCDPTTQICTRDADVGATCGGGVQCAGFANCIGGTCVARLKAGETCDPVAAPTCLGTLACEGGACTPPAPADSCI